MARLDVYQAPRRAGFVVDVQADLLAHRRTRIVVPLLPADDSPPAARDLNPVLTILGTPYVLVPQALASVPASELRQPVASLDQQADVILRALDIILLGY